MDQSGYFICTDDMVVRLLRLGWGLSGDMVYLNLAYFEVGL